MEPIRRGSYLNRLIEQRENGMIDKRRHRHSPMRRAS